MSARRGAPGELLLHADVLLAGGGPAGTWAALAAARAGASVVLVDKGYCGTSGAAAASNNNVWYVPDPRDYQRHFDERFRSGGGLSERSWTGQVLERVVTQLHLLGELGYPFPLAADGGPNRATLRGPDYMRFMRLQIRRAGVTIVDHAPLVALCRDRADGSVTGAWGERRDGVRWRVAAGATVLATGGCGFLGGALGTHVCTGDGHLAAGEVGASFSGMEFSNQYGLAAEFSSVTKGLPFVWASYSKRDGSAIPVDDDDAFVSVAKVLIDEPVYAVFDRASPDIAAVLRGGQANAFLPYDRLGIDPFTQRFAVGLRLEGTVRGTGGIRLCGVDCATGVDGLYAAGDAASREPIVGARTGGGSPNAAWAIATGSWAGEAASRFARSRRGHGGATPTRSALSSHDAYGDTALADPRIVRETLAQQVWPLQVNLFREGRRLEEALRAIDQALAEPSAAAATTLAAQRSARALLYVARLAYTSAAARRESRGLHRRIDYPQQDLQAWRQTVAGVETLELRREPVAA